MDNGKQIQKIILVICLFFYIFLAWKGEKAKSETVSLETPIEITIPAMLEVSLIEGESKLDRNTLRSDFALSLRSNSPWQVEIETLSNLSSLPEAPGPLSGPANKDNSAQIVPFQVEQPISWGDFGSYELLVIYSAKQSY